MKKLVYTIIPILLLSCQSINKNESVNLNPAEFKKAMETSSIVIDVRTPEEYAAGYIDGAININVYSNNFIEKVTKLNNGSSILIYCASGGRSSRALSMLKRNNIQAKHLEGGISNWIAVGYPIQQ